MVRLSRFGVDLVGGFAGPNGVLGRRHRGLGEPIWVDVDDAEPNLVGTPPSITVILGLIVDANGESIEIGRRATQEVVML
ncbi:MAG: hypothetical protein GY926_13215 [bacterium]|nr:hypothetical protein [bacterium]